MQWLNFLLAIYKYNDFTIVTVVWSVPLTCLTLHPQTLSTLQLETLVDAQTCINALTFVFR